MVNLINISIIIKVAQGFRLISSKSMPKTNENTKAVIINSPNNPTGVIYTKECLEALAKVIKEKEEEYTKLFANPYNAAKYGYIDDVIEPRNTRFRVIRALEQLATKSISNPAKKHGNIPL